MNRRAFLASALLPHVSAQNVTTRPNFLVVVVDDWGATDLGSGGSTFYRTPHLDQLATEGMRFTQAYSACTVCSPSRAALLTGKYPARLHLTDWIPGQDFPWARLRPPIWKKYLAADEQTIAEALKPLGYATASIGKWHLTTADNDPALLPEKQGFDVNLAGTGRGQPPSYFAPYRIPTLNDGPRDEYLTDREVDEACRFIRANRNRPFLLYLPHHAVHTPLQAKPEKVAAYKANARQDAPQRNPVYAAMIESLDEGIGTLMRTLGAEGLAENTVVIVTGDNGGYLPATVTNLGLRNGKGSAYEGGVRVPFLIRYPPMVKRGSTCDVPVIGCDLAATVHDMAGLKPAGMDGVSLKPLLQGKKLRREAIFWHYPHYHLGSARPYSAVRMKRHKLILFHEDNRVELYDLEADPEEKRDLAGSTSSLSRKLEGTLRRWLAETGAQMPTPNPAYDPMKAAFTAAQARAKGL
ncbi:MAG TPA: sulfatase, partial [Bryobacteraceae bacterium]|nr:sulfatase [Bryobacteraceae bacterium]